MPNKLNLRLKDNQFHITTSLSFIRVNKKYRGGLTYQIVEIKSL